MSRLPRLTTLLVSALLLCILVYAVVAGYRIVRWNAFYWLPAYWSQQLTTSQPKDFEHLVLVVADHYEPGFIDHEAVAANDRWLTAFDAIAARTRDSYEQPFRYTWFFPVDQANDLVLQRINRSVAAGYGEIEMHWHHPDFDNAGFERELIRALDWFAGHGAMVDRNGNRRFAFIHGNWALDASSRHCRVTREIDILRRNGGYMDMTFSTIGARSQPRHLLNGMYYVSDDDGPRSYDRGEAVRVGSEDRGRLLMFQGPLALGWDLRFEYGALESYALPSRSRIRRWLDDAHFVQGRPDWRFLKLYSHGIQSPELVDTHLEPMLRELRQAVEARGARLHFMTAREAYNVVRAAERGLEGDPREYRDLVIAPPQNSLGSELAAAHGRG